MTRIRINLLPHREAKRERQKKAFYFFTFLSLLAGLALVALVFVLRFKPLHSGAFLFCGEFISSSATGRKLVSNPFT
ncbi:MAG: hypothetical protein N2483_05410, partial [Burkholderiaceae bacterium]|nr:hypothetical protein [Burkholderiaceae bacterium]